MVGVRVGSEWKLEKESEGLARVGLRGDSHGVHEGGW